MEPEDSPLWLISRGRPHAPQVFRPTAIALSVDARDR